jgi:hypothetical protein
LNHAIRGSGNFAPSPAGVEAGAESSLLCNPGQRMDRIGSFLQIGEASVGSITLA